MFSSMFFKTPEFNCGSVLNSTSRTLKGLSVEKCLYKDKIVDNNLTVFLTKLEVCTSLFFLFLIQNK